MGSDVPSSTVLEQRARLGARGFAWLTPHRALASVALLMGIVGLPVALFDRQLRYDEIIYLSQSGVALDPLYMSAPRAWGMPILMGPISLVTTEPVGVRLILLGLSVAGLYLAFRPWLALVDRWVAPIAALLFATLWTTILFASMAYPNIWLAWLGVGGIGLALVALRTPQPGRVLAVLGVAFAAASLIRPTEALLLALPVVAIAAMQRRWAVSTVVATGTAAGWIAWLVEGYLRFGGPIERLRTASRVNDAGLFLDPRHLLISADGPRLLCRPIEECGSIDPIAVAWLIALPVLVVLGIAASRHRLPLLVASAAAMLVLAQYAFGFEWSHPRFLLPVYALLALPVGALIVRVARRSSLSMVVVAVLIAVHLGLQVRSFVAVARQLRHDMTRTDAIVAAIQARGVEAPCAVFHTGSLVVGFETGCRPIPTQDRPDAHDLSVVQALTDGERVVLVYGGQAMAAPLGWEVVRVDTRPPAWVVISPSTDQPPAPTGPVGRLYPSGIFGS